jgi:hypothetical protein
MTKKGGKLNQGMKDWLAFVDKVKLEENIDHRQAIIRAKARKDGGEEWRTSGGVKEEVEEVKEDPTPKEPKPKSEPESDSNNKNEAEPLAADNVTKTTSSEESVIEESNNGGKKGGKKTNKKQKGGKKTNKKQKGGKKSNKSKKRR